MLIMKFLAWMHDAAPRPLELNAAQYETSKTRAISRAVPTGYVVNGAGIGGWILAEHAVRNEPQPLPENTSTSNGRQPVYPVGRAHRSVPKVKIRCVRNCHFLGKNHESGIVGTPIFA